MEVAGDAAHFKPALGHGVTLRRDYAHRDARRLKPLERRLRVAEGANARVVDAVVVITIDLRDLRSPRLVAAGKVQHLVVKRRANPRHQLGVVKRTAQHVVHSIAHRSENDVVGVDQRAIRIEQHALNVVHGSLSGKIGKQVITIVGQMEAKGASSGVP